MTKRDLPEFIIIEGKDELGEFFEVDGELFNESELLENLKKWDEWDVSIIIDDWCNRSIAEDFSEVLYFPTQEDSTDYIRTEKGLDPLYHSPDNPYSTISKSEWLALLD